MADKAVKKPNIFVPIRRVNACIVLATNCEKEKIVWPSRKQVRNNFIVVAIFVTLAALLIFGLDTLFFTIMKFVVNLGSSAA